MAGKMFSAYLCTLCILATLLFSPALQAHSKPNHKLITQESIKALSKCKIKNNISQAQLDELVKVNLAQDKLLNKAVLWHFPMPMAGSGNPVPDKKRAIGYGKIVVDTTFDRWVAYLEDQAIKEKTFTARIPAIGAMLHYVQDLASPAHAVPIFHPSKIANPDHFDSWDSFKRKGSALDIDYQKICAELAAAKLKQVQDLLTEVRVRTLTSLKEKHSQHCQPSKATCDWTLFWPTEIIDHGFGHYGCDGEDKFGSENKFECNGTTYDIPKTTYTAFATARLTDAISASARLIVHFMKMEPGNRHPCMGNNWEPEKAQLECLKNITADNVL
ncbi:hypothetical protein SG34_031815 [Thalassomonas viridans]|uniref:Phospholipase C/D domain-containing protein n=1 Tax=Thalassomonas viridans TaxID=137584 RepID=A0AAE9Z891_9GAMM|nr:hypothetical protein [Thalassomonas viridans]WDE08511.1 hypothetical protein SG34_031815 [Thalassomonas viridans]